MGRCIGMCLALLIALTSYARTDSLIVLYTATDTTYYADFASALKQSNKHDDSRLVLLGDVSFMGEATAQRFTKSATLDLNGFTLGDTLKSNTSYLLYVGVDTVSLSVISSRPGGRIAVCRKYNGTLYAIYAAKGRVAINDIRIESRNLATYHADTCKNVSARCVSVDAAATLTMERCQLYGEADGSLYVISGSGKAEQQANMIIRDTRVEGRGRHNVYGINAACYLDLERDTIEMNCDSASAYGVVLSKLSTARITHCPIRVQSAKGPARALSASGDKGASADIHVSHCRLEARGYKDVYAILCYSTAKITHCELYAEAQETNALGLSISNYRDTTLGFDAPATIRDLTIHSSSRKTAYGLSTRANTFISQVNAGVRTTHDYAYALYVNSDSGTIVVDTCAFTALAGTTNAYGAYLSKGTTNLRDCSMEGVTRMDTSTVLKDANARGLYVSAAVTARAKHCSLRAEAKNANTAQYPYGMINAGNTELEDCDIYTSSDCKNAFGVYAYGNTSRSVFRNCRFKTYAPTDFGVIRKNNGIIGQLFFHEGLYSDANNLATYLPSDTCAIYKLWDHEDEYVQGYRYTIRDVRESDAIIACCYEPGQSAPLTRHYHLTDAFLYAEQHPNKELTIVIVGACILPKGEYTLPANATLLVPYCDGQTRAIGPVAERSINHVTRVPYITLTFADSAVLHVAGKMEVSAVQKCGNEGSGGVIGPYGLLRLAPTARINLLSGAEMQAWGYVTGEGTVEVQAGATIHEDLEIGGWKGGRVTYAMMNNSQRVFPLSAYFYQNIEAPVVYHAGSKAMGSTAETISSVSVMYDEMLLVGNQDALFVFQDSTSDATIRKAYDVTTDRIEWTLNGDVKLNELIIRFNAGLLGDYSLRSSHYVLPICSNMTLNVQSGELTVDHDAVMLPGTQAWVAPEASVHIPEGVKFFLYNDQQWYGFLSKRYWTPYYSPSWTTCPRDSVLYPAQITIEGTIQVDGALLATESGADILGTENAEGAVIFAGSDSYVYDLYQIIGNTEVYEYINSPSHTAALTNEDGSRVPTQDGGTFRYAEGVWTLQTDTVTPPDPPDPPEPPDPPHEDIDDIPTPATPRKILRDGVLFIERNNKIYTVTGNNYF